LPAHAKNRIGFYTTYQKFDYPNKEFVDADGVQAGIDVEHRLTRWLYLSSGYSAYLNKLDERLRDTQIHRVRLVALHYRPRRVWDIYVSGGAEYTDSMGYHRWNEYINAGIERRLRFNTLFLTYQRSFTLPMGLYLGSYPATLLTSDTATAGMNQALHRRINLQIASSYLRSEGFDFPECCRRTRQGPESSS